MRSVAFSLSLILVFSIPWENAITVGGLGTLTRFIGLLVLLVWIASLLVTGRLRKPHPFHLLVCLFVLWVTVSVFWSVDVDHTVMIVKTYVQLGLLAWIVWELYTTPKRLSMALQAYVLGAFVSIAATVSNFVAGQEISAFSGGRYAGAGLNAVDLALILTLGIPAAWHLTLFPVGDRMGRLLGLVNLAYIPVSLFAVALTGSRTALIAVVPAVIYIISTFDKLRLGSKVLVFSLALGSLFALKEHIPRSSIERLATLESSIARGDIGGRAAIWRATLVAFSDHQFLGVGGGALDSIPRVGTVAHNTFLSVLAELGVIGFILFAAILATAVYLALHQSKLYSGLWLAVLAVWVIGVSALTWEFRKPTWLFLSLIVVGAGLPRPNAPTGLQRRVPTAPTDAS